MKLKEIIQLTNAQVVTGKDVDIAEILWAYSSDLMSDVLTMDLERPLLLTSLATEQAVRTAHVVGAVAVLVANGKTPPPEMVALARKLDVPLARTALSKFDAAVALGRTLNC